MGSKFGSAAGALLGAGLASGVLISACSSGTGEGQGISNTEDLSSCSFAVTQNVYDGPNYWGTMTIKNSSSASVTGFAVKFTVPSGDHCTNDSVPSGAKLSPLTGSGTSATTTSNACTYTWPSATLAAGASMTFNYSTDNTNFSAATGVTVTSSACGTTTGSSSGSGSSGGSSSGSPSGSSSGSGSSCSLSVTANSYDGPNYWGTMTVKNSGPSAAKGYSVQFTVPSGDHCTNDTVPSGATLSPLTGSGTSATTTSNVCKFTWASSTLAAGSSMTFNYSTDSTNFSSASNASASSASCTGTGSGSSSSSSSGSGSGSSSGSSSGSTGGGTGCDSPGLVWKTANETVFESYPPPGSAECIQYSGCMYEGQFQECSKTVPKSWVQSHNIVSVFPDISKYAYHDLCLRDDTTGKTIVVIALDTCADSDCSGCCTQNRGSANELIDVEINTDSRFMNLGIDGGAHIHFADLGPANPSSYSGCN
jgi:hypothetical protein